MNKHLGLSDMQFKIFCTFCEKSQQLPTDMVLLNLLIICVLCCDLALQRQKILSKLLFSFAFCSTMDILYTKQLTIDAKKTFTNSCLCLQPSSLMLCNMHC
jgi:hypothetical protein